LKQIDFNGKYEFFELSEEVTIGLPNEYSLSQNYPNPFNPTTKIDFAIPADGLVTIKIFDNLGKECLTLLNEETTAGYHTVTFNAGLPSGVYYYSIKAGSFTAVKKMLLLR
jgi:hypothetical protein